MNCVCVCLVLRLPARAGKERHIPGGGLAVASPEIAREALRMWTMSLPLPPTLVDPAAVLLLLEPLMMCAVAGWL